jgi:hypothetical protein
LDRDNPPDHEHSTRTMAAGDEQQTQAPRPATGQGPDKPGTSAPDIMSRLPKSRPQRDNERRRATTARTAKSPAAPRTPAAGSGTQPARSSAKRPARGSAKSPAQGAKRTTAARARTAPAAAARPAPARRAPAGTESAPSLPRLAWDGATEAAKLPLKVSGRLTLRALDAVARGLRGR